MKRSTFIFTTARSATGVVTLPAAALGHGAVGGRNDDLLFTPLASQRSVITAASDAFVRNHAGVPNIDASRHRLIVHGFVDRPLSFSMADLMRFPSVEHRFFIECAGNSGRGWQQLGNEVTFSHGLVQCANWTGVPLRLLLQEAGVQPQAQWVVVEGADDAHFDRSLPLSRLDEALVVYRQNGAPLLPEHGYPVRLVVPGFEGSTNVKWLRRIKLVASPVFSREETAQYSELLPDGKIHLFEFVMGVKSVIVAPSPGMQIAANQPFSAWGFAWSGNGRITAVEISLDGGQSWQAASLDADRSPKSFTRFTFPLHWTGKPMVLMSRATDDSNNVQPTRDEYVARRGTAMRYHVNTIAGFRIGADGRIMNVDE